MKVGRVAGEVGRGLAAGLAGTAAMTVASTVEARVRGRGASTVPAQVAEKVLQVEPEDEAAENRLSNLTHWGYGTSWGIARALIAQAGLPRPAATALHFGAVWGSALVMLPGMGVAPPPTKWGVQEVAIDAGHHLVYAIAAGVTYDYLAHAS